MREIAAPDGYEPDHRVLIFDVTDNGCFFPVENENGEEVVAGGCTFEFENTPKDPPPRRRTGGSTPPDTVVEEDDEPEAGIIETEVEPPVMEEVIEEEAPQAGPDLPRTGGSTALYYVSGLAFLGAGIWLQRRQRRAA